MIARRRIFEAVFPTQVEKPQSTPQATPRIGTGSFGSSFGGPSQDDEFDQIQLDRAWHRVTESLQIPNGRILLEHEQQRLKALQHELSKAIAQGSQDSLRYLLKQNTISSSTTTSIASWYTEKVTRHYLRFQAPYILECLGKEHSLEDVLHLLLVTQRIYLLPWHGLLTGSLDVSTLMSPVSSRADSEDHLRQAFHAVVSLSLKKSPLIQDLKLAVTSLVREYWNISEEANSNQNDAMQFDDPQRAQEARQRLRELLQVADDVGMGGKITQRILAEAMSDAISSYVRNHYETSWTSPSTISSDLEQWIEDEFTPFARQMLVPNAMSLEDSITQPVITTQDIESWKARATNELGQLRLKQLFELTVSWDDSRGAIEDLKHYVSTSSARMHVTSQFSEELVRRLLQPGASTSQILDIYIRLIQVFAVLDPRGVLLDRVARPVRRYLREREDTVKLIVGGLLANPEQTENPDPLAILAIRLEEATQAAPSEDDTELDWDDMDWVPDPMDAGPEYKKSKSSDVIGNLISLFETRDVFVKEFQNILGDRLLQVKSDFEAETRLLELLKIRFGEGVLQSCEVMLRDVSDSMRIDTWVKREQNMDHSINISTKVLSRLFWPALHTESFKLPPAIKQLQDNYAVGFERYKTSRKLTWLDVLGDVTVELELEDRTVVEIVKTPQAAIIYAFTSEASKPIRKTAEQLVEELEMDEDLVENGLLFWVGKLVLLKAADHSYSVLERLPSAARDVASPGEASKSSTLAAAAMASATAAAAPVSALRSEEDIAEEKMQVYWQFIVGMLTNQGAMPLARIVMMLKLAMAGGFPYSNEELRAFLSRRCDEGKLELAGAQYKLVK